MHKTCLKQESSWFPQDFEHSLLYTVEKYEEARGCDSGSQTSAQWVEKSPKLSCWALSWLKSFASRHLSLVSWKKWHKPGRAGTVWLTVWYLKTAGPALRGTNADCVVEYADSPQWKVKCTQWFDLRRGSGTAAPMCTGASLDKVEATFKAHAVVWGGWVPNNTCCYLSWWDWKILLGGIPGNKRRENNT